jgi:hypothetical protein
LVGSQYARMKLGITLQAMLSMDLAYLTGQRPADVRVLRRNYIEGVALGVKQQKTHKKLRALLEVDGVERSLVAMISIILAQNEQ